MAVVQALRGLDATRDPEIVNEWEDLLRVRKPPRVLQSSPEWIDHLMTTGDDRVVVFVVRDESGKAAGIVPARSEELRLGYEPRSRMALSNLRVLSVLGGVPLLSEDAGTIVVDALEGVLRASPDCDAILLRPPVESADFRLLERWPAPDRLLIHCLEAELPVRTLKLDRPFAAYLGGLRKKARNDQQRLLRRLREHGDVEVVRCQSVDEVDAFLAEVDRIRAASWKQALVAERNRDNVTSRRSVLDLARRGLLRSYLLRHAGTPRAFWIGFQGRGVYYCWETGYDLGFAHHSPGTVLLYLLIEDLFARDPPALLDFGPGDQEFKRRLGTCETQGSTWLALRPTLSNALKIRSHALLRRIAKFPSRTRRRIGLIRQ